MAWIAEKHLTAEARQLVEKLLGENSIDPQLKRWCGNATTDLLVDASTWPDDVRSDRKNGPWHYIDIPRGKHNGDLDGYCGPEGCVTSVIEQQRAILKDNSADPVKRAKRYATSSILSAICINHCTPSAMPTMAETVCR